MKKYICYILRSADDAPAIESCQRDNHRLLVTTMVVNPKHFTGMCARRYNEVYIDAEFFRDSSGKDFIEYIAKPMASLGEDARYYFI